MIYKNVKTGNVWDITDPEILKRVEKDSDFERVSAEIPNNTEDDKNNVPQEDEKQADENSVTGKEVNADGSVVSSKDKAQSKK